MAVRLRERLIAGVLFSPCRSLANPLYKTKYRDPIDELQWMIRLCTRWQGSLGLLAKFITVSAGMRLEKLGVNADWTGVMLVRF
jgi:hypothetical protein